MLNSKVARKAHATDSLRYFQNQAVQFADYRPQRDGAKAINSEPIVQQKPNNTGLPNGLKSGIEHLSGYSMDDVQVHYNSAKPAQLQAHAYAQGNQIHIGPGQERHLPHEAWHVVQQKQGRVRPTMQLKPRVNINDDVSLEKEADVMGARAFSFQLKQTPEFKYVTKTSGSQNVQCKSVSNGHVVQLAWGDLLPMTGMILGGVSGGMLGGSIASSGGPLGAYVGGKTGATVGALAGQHAGSMLRQSINNFRNRNSGYKVSILTTGGATRAISGIITGGVKGRDSDESPGLDPTSRRMLGTAIGTAGLMGHVALKLQSPDGAIVYGMNGGGIKKESMSSGSTRESHNITEEQYKVIVGQIKQDTGKKLNLVKMDSALIKKMFGQKVVDNFSCASWAMKVMRAASVPAGSWFDRYVLPIPVIMAQSGWHNTLFGKEDTKEKEL